MLEYNSIRSIYIFEEDKYLGGLAAIYLNPAYSDMSSLLFDQ